MMLIMSQASDMVTIYIDWFIASIFFTMIINARGTLMAEVVSADRYTSGNATALSLLNGAKLLGPLLGGCIVLNLNIKILLYFTFTVYLGVAICAYMIRTSYGQTVRKDSFLDNVRKGLHFIIESRTFSLLASIAFFWRLFLGLQLSLFVIYVKSFLHCTSSQYGFFITVMGVGSIIGSLLGPYAAKRTKAIRLIVGGLTLHYATFALLGLCRNYYLSLFIVFASYAVFYITLVSLHSVRDRICPLEIRGSAYGTVTAMLTPPAIISMLAGSFLADRFSVTAVLFGAGVLALLSLYLALFIGKNATRELRLEKTLQQPTSFDKLD
jgi:MFS family permease